MRNTLISILIIGLILTFLIGIFQLLNHTYIKAEFKNADPMPPRMEVFYKGYKLGTTRKIRISDDFKTTYLYITLNQRGLHLPKNISAEVKQYDKETKYVALIYPSAPSLRFIKTGDIIKGKSTLSLNGISDLNQAHIDSLADRGVDLLSSAKGTTESLTAMFDIVTDILEENRSNIYSITLNLRNSMENLNKTTYRMQSLSGKLDDEITRGTIRTNSKNIEQLTGNFAKSSDKIYLFSGSLGKSGDNVNVLVNNANSLVDVLKLTVCNVNDIIIAFKETLRKKFGGARVLFKQPVP